MCRLYRLVIYLDIFWAVHFLSFCCADRRVSIQIKASSAVCGRISVISQPFCRQSQYRVTNVSLRYYHEFSACTVFALFKFVLFVFVSVLTAQRALAKDRWQ